MRKQTELRTVDIKEDKPSARQQTRTTAEITKPISSLEQSLITKMNEMERWMEESFHRPFLGQSWLPFKSLFHEAGSFGDISPSVDVYEESGAVVVKAELPGMRREDVSVRLVDNNLIISGEKKAEERVEQKDYLRLERSRGSFTRTLPCRKGSTTKVPRHPSVTGFWKSASHVRHRAIPATSPSSRGICSPSMVIRKGRASARESGLLLSARTKSRLWRGNYR